jgi:hypothetical protein
LVTADDALPGLESESREMPVASDQDILDVIGVGKEVEVHPAQLVVRDVTEAV